MCVRNYTHETVLLLCGILCLRVFVAKLFLALRQLHQDTNVCTKLDSLNYSTSLWDFVSLDLDIEVLVPDATKAPRHKCV